MQYLNTEYGREGREKSRGQPEQIEKMVLFWINKKRVVVAVKDKQRLEAGEEMRVAYGWTKAVWAAKTQNQMLRNQRIRKAIRTTIQTKTQAMKK